MSPQRQKKIQNFISFKFSNFRQVRSVSSIQWVFENDNAPYTAVIEYDKLKNLWIRESLWIEIKNMCGLRKSQVRVSIKFWVQVHWGLEKPSPIPY